MFIQSGTERQTIEKISQRGNPTVSAVLNRKAKTEEEFREKCYP
jgi:hypothetical protein